MTGFREFAINVLVAILAASLLMSCGSSSSGPSLTLTIRCSKAGCQDWTCSGPATPGPSAPRCDTSVCGGCTTKGATGA